MDTLESAKYITIHGPDGVGKTSVGRNIVSTFIERGQPAVFFDDWRIKNNQENPFSSLIFQEAIKTRPQAYIALQLAKLTIDSMDITDLTDSGIMVIKDRGIFDVRADLRYRGFDPDDFKGPLIREPDFSVLLAVSEGARRKRLENKWDVRHEDYQPNTPGNRMFEMSQSLVEQVGDRLPDQGMIVETDEMTLEDVVMVITNRIIGIT